eukprot:11202749-Lingulodinium_polyedra.AAC.1
MASCRINGEPAPPVPGGGARPAEGRSAAARHVVRPLPRPRRVMGGLRGLPGPRLRFRSLLQELLPARRNH